MIVVTTITAAILKVWFFSEVGISYTSDHVITGLVLRVPNGIIESLVAGFAGNGTACLPDWITPPR